MNEEKHYDVEAVKQRLIDLRDLRREIENQSERLERLETKLVGVGAQALTDKLAVRKGAAVGVMRYGKIYGRVAEGVEPAYGDSVYLITEGEEAGCFTNAASQTEGSTTIAVKGRFVGGVDTNAQIAPIELFNQAQA